MPKPKMLYECRNGLATKRLYYANKEEQRIVIDEDPAGHDVLTIEIDVEELRDVLKEWDRRTAEGTL